MFEACLLVYTTNIHRPLAMISKVSISTSLGQEEIELRCYLYLSYVEFWSCNNITKEDGPSLKLAYWALFLLSIYLLHGPFYTHNSE